MNLFSSFAAVFVYFCLLFFHVGWVENKKKDFFFPSHALTVSDLCGMPVNASLTIHLIFFLSTQHI